jgi:alanine racemase
MFVIKANAYGFSYQPIVEFLTPYQEVDFFGVSSIEEAKHITQFTTKKIVVLGYTKVDTINSLNNPNIICTIHSIEDLIYTKNTQIFINIDTGFHRLGIEPSNINKERLKQHKNILGIFTHLTLQSKESDHNQIKTFQSFIKDLNIPYISISDSIAYTRYHTNENLYRIGALLYGLQSKKEQDKLKVCEAFSLVTTITRIQKIKEDTTAFYRTKLQKGMVIATIQIGYGDGLFRDMKNSYVTVTGRKCRYIEVGMDQSIIDVTNVSCKKLDQVTIFGQNGISLEELSTILQTNKNNIISNLSKRITRKYIGNTIKQYEGLSL